MVYIYKSLMMEISHKMETYVRIEENDAVDYLLVAFKIAKRGSKELFVNRLASWLTLLTKNDATRNASHVEIMLKENSKWFRYSIMKQRGVLRRTPDGGENITWTPGKVHKIESDENMLNRDYVFIVLPTTTSDIAAIKLFLDSQVGAGFNREGYLLNFVTPFRFGVTATNPKKLLRGHKKIRWFCSELITSALQNLKDRKIEEIKKLIPCEQSPNDLYQILQNNFKEIDFRQILEQHE